MFYIFAVEGDVAITEDDFGAVIYKHEIDINDRLQYISVLVSVIESYIRMGPIKIIARSAEEAYGFLIDINYYDFTLRDNTLISVDILREIVSMYGVELEIPDVNNKAEELLVFVRKFVDLFDSFNLETRHTLKVLGDE